MKTHFVVVIPPNKLKHYRWFLNGIAIRTQVKPHGKTKKMPTTMKTNATKKVCTYLLWK
jgi:hypothetical protein